MASGAYDGARALARAAARLEGPRGGLPALFLFTDPERAGDPLAAAERLPAGCGVVLRHFGREDQIALAPRLAALARRRGLVFLVANDPELARRVGADGVHWPERRLAEARAWGRRRSDMIQTGAAHSPAALRRAAGLDAVFLSPVFASASPSAGAPLGAWRAGAMARLAPVPVYALGGVDAAGARRLAGLGFSGAAAVAALSG